MFSFEKEKRRKAKFFSVIILSLESEPLFRLQIPQKSGRQAKSKKPSEGRANVFYPKALPGFLQGWSNKEGGGCFPLKKKNGAKQNFSLS